MAGNPESENCRVYITNIPYNATKEQLVHKCSEIGPVVDFILMSDKENGRPKGSGICEYRDGETAASACRNLGGCMFMGRELRVELAESYKNSYERKMQMQSQIQRIGGPSVAAAETPIGGPAANAAANVMAQLVGSSPSSSSLTLHLSQMSETQLTEVLSHFKEFATQNEEQARQILLAYPNFKTALLQAHIMLGLVTPQMLQSIQQPLVQNAGLPPLAPKKTQEIRVSDQSGLPTTSSSFNQQMQHPFSHNIVPPMSHNAAALQVQLPADVDPTLLDQALNLTEEQISFLPPDQQRQVIQLQLQHRMGLPFNL